MEFFIGIVVAFLPTGEANYVSASFPDRASCEIVTAEFVQLSKLELPQGAEIRFECVSSVDVGRRIL